MVAGRRVAGRAAGAAPRAPAAGGGVEPAELAGHAPNEFLKYRDEAAPSVSPSTLLTIAIVFIVMVILAHFYRSFSGK